VNINNHNGVRLKKLFVNISADANDKRL